jgi:two-component system response regulator YesN
LWVLAGAIMFGILAAVFCSRRIYSPVKAFMMKCGQFGMEKNALDGEFAYMEKCFDFLVRETNQLNGTIHDMQGKFRESLLLMLLREWIPWNGELYQKCVLYNLPVDGCYVAAVLSFPHREEIPVARELLFHAPYPVGVENRYILPTGDGTLTLVLVYGMSGSEQNLRPMSQFAAAEFTDFLHQNGIEVYTGIGGTCKQINRLHESYREASMALSGVNMQDAEEEPGTDFIPELKRGADHILSALKKGNLQEASCAFDVFSQRLEARGADGAVFAYQGYKILASALLLEQGEETLEQVLRLNMFYRLDGCKSREEVRALFVEELFPELYGKNRQRQKSMIPIVRTFIQEHIQEDITLQTCAELCGMSPSYLSRIFKKETGVSFLDFVSQCKVQEAQRLLQETNLSISQIAEKIGYSARNFYRVFYKVAMMSPNEYRQIHP